MSTLSERFASRAPHIAKYGDYGHSVALEPETVHTLLADHRAAIPADVLERFTAAQSAATPPTHILLKPSAFIRLTDAIQRERPEADHTDVP